MKKIDPQKHSIKQRISKKRAEKSKQRKKKAYTRNHTRTVTAPRNLSFSENPSGTIKFFDELKENALADRRFRRRGRWVNRDLYIDLTKVERISIPSAVVLSAELHRWSILKEARLHARGSKRWHPRVRQLLSTLGVFDLLGVAGVKEGDLQSINELILLPLTSDTRTDQEAIYKLQSDLLSAGVAFSERSYIFEAMSEAAINCIDHAYPKHHPGQKFPYAGHRWWATSCYDPFLQEIRFFVFDQGVGIPETLKIKQTIFSAIKQTFTSLKLPENDSTIIQGAFEVGRTRTGLAERGRGLDQMKDVLKQANGGSLRVLSGCGDVKMTHTGKVERNLHPSHIGGTLIEWSIPYDRLACGTDE